MTVTATVGSETESRSFTWTVPDASLPRVTFAINDTADTSDDLGVVGCNPIPVRVTLHYAGAEPGALYAVELSVPSGRAAFETQTVLLADGESAEVMLDALQISGEADDVVLVAQVADKKAGEDKMSNLAFKWEGQDWTNDSRPHVRAKNTPKLMADRIPPREFSTFQFEIIGEFNPKETLPLTIKGGSVANGYAQFAASDGTSNVVTYAYPVVSLEI